jgi:hypothetical protein
MFELLRDRYPAQSYALFREVQSATAYQGRQRADAVAMGLWPSRGLDMIGFEFKAHRGDWLRELGHPRKAEEIFQYCDRWYLVAHPGVAQAAEIPTTWGWLIAEERLEEAKQAPQLQPKPIGREFLASLLRSAQTDRDRPAKEIRLALAGEIRREVAEESERVLNQLREQITTDGEQHRKQIQHIESALGVSLSGWNLPVETVGAALGLVMDDSGGLLQRFSRAKGIIADLLTSIEDAETELGGLCKAQARQGAEVTP